MRLPGSRAQATHSLRLRTPGRYLDVPRHNRETGVAFAGVHRMPNKGELGNLRDSEELRTAADIDQLSDGGVGGEKSRTKVHPICGIG